MSINVEVAQHEVVDPDDGRYRFRVAPLRIDRFNKGESVETLWGAVNLLGNIAVTVRTNRNTLDLQNHHFSAGTVGLYVARAGILEFARENDGPTEPLGEFVEKVSGTKPSVTIPEMSLRGTPEAMARFERDRVTELALNHSQTTLGLIEGVRAYGLETPGLRFEPVGSFADYVMHLEHRDTLEQARKAAEAEAGAIAVP